MGNVFVKSLCIAATLVKSHNAVLIYTVLLGSSRNKNVEVCKPKYTILRITFVCGGRQAYRTQKTSNLYGVFMHYNTIELWLSNVRKRNLNIVSEHIYACNI